MRLARVVVAAGGCLFAGIVIGAGLGQAGANVPNARSAPVGHSRYHKLDLFARALATIEQQYVRPVDGDRLLYAAIRGLVAELDPHSEFLDPREARLLREEIEGAFGGIGIVVGLERDESGLRYLTVREVIPDGPAHEAGIRPGDRIVAIAGRPIAHFVDLRKAVMTMRGDPGTRISFTVLDVEESARRTVTLVRARIDPPAVEARILGDGIGVLRMRDFPERGAREVATAIDRMRRELGGEKLRGVVLDLRGNGGGLLDEAIAVTDVFLAKGLIVRTRGRSKAVLDEAHARRPGTKSRLPVVVLINGATASAAEIVAGALQDHGRALVVGERSYGKGSVQAPFELGDGSLLKLTVALYYTPNDRLIQATGIVPDVHVGGDRTTDRAPRSDSSPEVEPEREHPRHLRPEDFGGVPVAPPEEGPALKSAGDDLQLRVAVEHLLAWKRVRPDVTRRGRR
jgi:carboxyl-terminal processing protease